jgi:OmpA-OmpF porin, OOP family
MKKIYTYPFLFLLFFFSHSVATAQVGKGQKMLEDKNYAGAQVAFGKAFGDPSAAPAAYLGWAKAVLSAKSTTYDSAMTAHNYLTLAESLYKAADTKGKTEMQKEGMSIGSVDTQKKAALTKAWEGIVAAYQATPDNAAYFDQMDYLAQLGFFKRGATNKKIVEVRSAIIGQAWASRDDYKSLSAIMSRHDGMIPAAVATQKGMTRAQRLWSAFQAEAGMKQFDEFKKSHPSHWASIDCKSDMAIKAFKSESVTEQFKFFTENPQSCLVPDALVWWYGQLADKSAAKQEIGAAVFDQYEAIAQVLGQENNQSASNSQILNAVKTLAPAQVAFAAVSRGVDMHLKKKQWDDARNLVRDAKSLFPDDEHSSCNCENYTRKSWFSQIGKILDTPDGNSGSAKPMSDLNTASNEMRPVVAGAFMYFGAEGRPSGVGKADPYRVLLSASSVKGDVEPTTTFAGPNDEYVLSTTSDGSEVIIAIADEPHYAILGAKGWSKPTRLADMFKTSADIGRATLSPTGDYLIFAARGAEGNSDLYLSAKNYGTGAWGAASTLPKPVNTVYSEKSPFLHADGRSLYFASDGLLGLGGQDLFLAKRLDDTWLNWAEPVNLGKTINTNADDSETSFSVGAPGNIGYFAMTNTSGKSDIYSVELPVHARAETVNAVTLKATMPNQQVVVSTVDGEVIKTIKVGPEGQLSFALNADYESVVLTSSADSIFAVPLKLDLGMTKSNPVMQEEFKMQTLGQLNQTGMTLPDRVFHNNGTDLNMEGQVALERYFKMVSKRNAPLVIIGHTDSASNKTDGRTESIKNALINLGYDASLISIENKGTEEPLGSNDTEAGRKKNRRVEVKVMRK